MDCRDVTSDRDFLEERKAFFMSSSRPDVRKGRLEVGEIYWGEHLCRGKEQLGEGRKNEQSFNEYFSLAISINECVDESFGLPFRGCSELSTLVERLGRMLGFNQ